VRRFIGGELLTRRRKQRHMGPRERRGV